MTKTEDEGIAPGQWEALNRVFYDRKSGPHTYVVARLGALDGMDHDSRVVESVNLLHHAAEALVRHFLAHRGAPDCPWLEIARLRNFAESKAVVSSLREASGGTHRENLIDVFCGPMTGRTPAALAAIELAGEGLEALLAFATEALLDEAGMYNAVKHGIAAVPGKRPLPAEVLEAGKGAIMRGGGLSLLTLEPVGEGSERQWTRVIRYIDVAENTAMTTLIAQQLENLWAVARMRYLGTPLGRLHPVMKDLADRARYSAGLNAPATFEQFAISLQYLVGPDDAPAPQTGVS